MSFVSYLADTCIEYFPLIVVQIVVLNNGVNKKQELIDLTQNEMWSYERNEEARKIEYEGVRRRQREKEG